MQVADLYAGLSLKVDPGSFSVGEGLIKGVKGGMVALGAAAIAGSLALYEGVKSVVEFGSSLNDLSQKTGQSVENLQELGYIAKINSSDMESVVSATTKLSRGLQESAKTGTGPAVDGLNALHLSLSDINKLPVDKQLDVIAQAIAKMPDGPVKTAAAMNLLGKSGASLIPTLNDLGANGVALRAKFRAMGGELSGKDAAGLDHIGDQADTVKFQLGALKNKIVVALMPQIEKLVTGMSDWVSANKDLITGGIQTFVDDLIAGFAFVSDAIGVVIDVVSTIRDVFTAAFDGDEGAQALLLGIGAAIGAVVLPALWSIVAAWWGMVPAVWAATWPVILIGAAIGLIAYAVIKLVKNWDKVKEVAVRVGQAISDAFHAAVDWVADKIQWIMDKLQALIDVAKNAASALLAPGKAIGNKVFDFVHGTADDQLDKSDDDYNQGLKNRAAGIHTGMYNPAATVNPSTAGNGGVQVNGGVNVTVTVPEGTSSDAAKKMVVDLASDMFNGHLRDAQAAHQ